MANCRLKDSTHDKLRKLAFEKHMSINDVIEELLAGKSKLNQPYQSTNITVKPDMPFEV